MASHLPADTETERTKKRHLNQEASVRFGGTTMRRQVPKVGWCAQ